MKLLSFFEKHKKSVLIVSVGLLVVLFLMPIITTKYVSRGKEYRGKNDVALYLMTYHELPKNYITQYGVETAEEQGGDLSNKVVGGDTHWNASGLDSFGIYAMNLLKECDIADVGYDLQSARGTKRLVYTSNTDFVRVFYTENHYQSYTEITNFSIQLTRNIFWFVFVFYFVVFGVFSVLLVKSYRKSITADKKYPVSSVF